MTLRTIYGRMRTAVQSQRLTAGFYRFQLVGFSIVILGLSVSLSAAEPAKRMFNIEAKPAAQSLTDYAQQAHTQLGYDVDIVDDILTNAVVGEYDSAEALELLLEDTGLTAEHGERGIFIRRVPKRVVGGDIEERTPPVAQTNSLRFAQASAAEVHAAVGQNQTSGRSGTDSGEGEEKRPLEEIIVTGTNIRGIAPDSSPTRTYTREDIQISGAGTAQNFIQTLPFNFGGGSNEDAPGGLPNDVDSRQNFTLGSSANLRGLGSGATLVLLNGRRLPPSSSIGNFVDISLIPVSALERVEVLADGASAIYGADAIAGVVNFITRDEYDGIELSLRAGTTPQGSRDEYRASSTGGKRWNTGRGLIAYEFLSQTDLSAADRSFAQNALLPNDLLPSQRRHSALVSVSQDIAAKFEIYADILYSTRMSIQDFTGGTFDSVASTTFTSDNLSVAAGGSWEFTDEWFFDFGGTFGDLQSESDRIGDNASLSKLSSGLWIADTKVSGPLLRLPGGVIKLAVGGQFRREDFTHFRMDEGENGAIQAQLDRDVYAFFGEAQIPIIGPENVIPGVKQFEVNVSGRFEDFTDFGSTTNPKVGVLWSPIESLRLRGSYGTSFNPPSLGRSGALDRGALVVPTSFHNLIFGFTPGDPSIADVVAITALGTDTNLVAETSRAYTAGLDFNTQRGRHRFAFTTTWFDFAFENRLGTTPLPESRNIFDAPNIAFNNPELFPPGTIVFSPSLDQINEILANLNRPPAIFPGSNPLDAEIINNVNVTRNLAGTFVQGFDFDLDYSFDSYIGQFLLGLDGSYLLDFQQQASSSTPAVEQVDTLYNPVDLKLRGHAGYANRGFAGNMFVNYTDSYRVDNTLGGALIDSWTTVDLSLSYNTTSQIRNNILDNTLLRVSVTNLFNEAPPSTPTDPLFRIFGFDPANASPLGRFISVEITKQLF